jgi:hypothetical protein
LQLGQDHRSPVPATKGTEQKGQIVSAAGGIDLSFLRSEKDVPDRSRRRKTRTAATGAAIRITQMIAANPASTGTAQKATEMVIRE